ncbi:MAG TPA: pectinesterase family protein [Opitutaceae bacterium]|nr:pectinesterase family protein [Opitutaceae bacterium]
MLRPLLPAVLAFAPLAAAPVARLPADRAGGVDPDTHLVLTFSSPPALGKSGLIRIYDAADHRLVDTLDLSVPAGPDPSGPRAPSPVHTPGEPALPRAGGFAPGHPTNANTPRRPSAYQLTIIGGVVQGFHFRPVIIRGDTATIYPHNNLLEYRHRYAVEIDPGVLTLADGSFGGIGPGGWTFATREAPPPADAERVVVAADGSGDFSTVQGALDWAPDHPARRITVFIRNGRYEEIVFCHDKHDLTLQGESRDGVQISYGNNSVFNGPEPRPGGGYYPGGGGPSRRCSFAAYDCSGLILEDFSTSNTLKGQAEGLLLSGERNLVRRVNVTGSGDALNLRGSAYFADCRIAGDGDTILGVGPAFFRRCELNSWGAYMWIRNPASNHGNVFVECTFRPPSTPRRLGRNSDPVLARLPNNHGINYPYAEAVLIDCKLQGIPPQGWGPIDDDTSHLHLWEYHSTNLADGRPADVSRRHPVSKQLTLPHDAQLIARYSDPAFVLGGWNPEATR